MNKNQQQKNSHFMVFANGSMLHQWHHELMASYKAMMSTRSFPLSHLS
jgi:hypothetical protein